MLNAIIIGAGEVGLSIAQHLVQENHNVVLIDNDPLKLQQVLDVLDVQVLEGVGSHPDILAQAGADKADLLIAATNSDEVNMVACQIAYSLFKVRKKIARVRDVSYLNVRQGKLYNRDDMPIDVIISPEKEVADAVVRAVAVPGAFDVTYFAEGLLSLIGFKVASRCPIRHVALQHLRESFHMMVHVVAIYRGDRVIFPDGADHLEEDDEVYFLCHTRDRLRIMEELGYAEEKIRNVMVIGGGNIGYEIAKQLEGQGIYVRVVENNRTRAEELSRTLKTATVLHGDALDRELLVQENVGKMDAVFCMTSDDPSNMLAAITARQLGASNIITRIGGRMLMPLVESLKLDKAISPREVTASRILQHVRRSKSRVIELHTIHHGDAEVIEMEVTYDSPSLGSTLAGLSLPEGARVAVIMRATGEILFPTGRTTVQEGDHLILVTSVGSVHEVEAII